MPDEAPFSRGEERQAVPVGETLNPTAPEITPTAPEAMNPEAYAPAVAPIAAQHATPVIGAPNREAANTRTTRTMPRSRRQPIIKQKHGVVIKQQPIVKKEQPIVKKLQPIVKKQQPIVKKQQPVIKQQQPVVVKKQQQKKKCHKEGDRIRIHDKNRDRIRGDRNFGNDGFGNEGEDGSQYGGYGAEQGGYGGNYLRRRGEDDCDDGGKDIKIHSKDRHRERGDRRFGELTEALFQLLVLLFHDDVPAPTSAKTGVPLAGTSQGMMADLIGIPEDFKVDRPQVFECVAYSLFLKLDHAWTTGTFKTCWPIFDRAQSREFRNHVFKGLEALRQEGAMPPGPPLRRSHLDDMRGGRLALPLLHLAMHTMRAEIAKDHPDIAPRDVLRMPVGEAVRSGSARERMVEEAEELRRRFEAFHTQRLVMRDEWRAFAKETEEELESVTEEKRMLVEQFGSPESLTAEVEKLRKIRDERAREVNARWQKLLSGLAGNPRRRPARHGGENIYLAGGVLNLTALLKIWLVATDKFCCRIETDEDLRERARCELQSVQARVKGGEDKINTMEAEYHMAGMRLEKVARKIDELRRDRLALVNSMQRAEMTQRQIPMPPKTPRFRMATKPSKPESKIPAPASEKKPLRVIQIPQPSGSKARNGGKPPLSYRDMIDGSRRGGR
ncbi:hypothetical protein HK101_007885 [Irineochytrium annulatum]|nr:hypothetical protein HK101_007885 [Irineochytrium annulatum]